MTNLLKIFITPLLVVYAVYICQIAFYLRIQMLPANM